VFYQGTTLLSLETIAPYSVDWTPLAADLGNQTLTAIATDDAGATTTSTEITVVVEAAANIAPSVSLSSPAVGTSTTVGTAVLLEATASDTDGTVAQVDFYLGNTLLGTDSTAPYAFSWTPAISALGTQTLTAQASDDSGAITTSLPVNIMVTEEVNANLPPSVSLTSPIDGTAATVGTTVTLTATASDTDGTIDQVAFYQGSSLLGVVTTAPYTLTWTPTSAEIGAQSLSAIATDDAGDSTTGTAITVTIEESTTSQSGLVGHWQFESGSGTTLLDNSANSHDLNYNGAWTTGQVGSSAGQFTGNENGGLGAPLLQTDQSYSISAWVKLDSLNGWQTFVGQDAEQVSGFWLQYSQQQGGYFFFSIYEQDTLSSGSFRVRSIIKPTVGTWYHLVAVRDKANGKMRLYINGVLEGEANETSNWNATGEFVIGRGKWGSPNDYTNGAIDEVNVYDYPITQSEVDLLYQAPTP